MNALVLGNGQSRKGQDLSLLSKTFIIYGCNGIYRDFAPNYLVAMDEKMTMEILDCQAETRSVFYTQHSNKLEAMALQGRKINFQRPEPTTLDSGTAAVKLATGLGHKKIYLLGFDYISHDQTRYNNVYAGTRNYGPRENHTAEVNLKRWQGKMNRLMMDHPDVEYIRVNLNDYPTTIRAKNFHNIGEEEWQIVTNS